MFKAFNETEMRNAWGSVLACFGVALFVRGFTSYGQAVFLNQLQVSRHWSPSLIGGATTLSFLCAALLLPWVSGAVRRFGSRVVLTSGVGLVGLGSVAISRSGEPWHLYMASIVVGVGSAAASATAISIALAERFTRQRGFALSLALSGISVGGFTVAPGLLLLAQLQGFEQAVLQTVAGLVLVLLPLTWWGLKWAVPAQQAAAVAPVSGSRLLLDTRFWSIAAPFSLVLAAQVGVLVYQVDYLVPLVGTERASASVACVAVAALLGRIFLGANIDRLPPRRASAVIFAFQSASTAMLIWFPSYPIMLYVASCLLGIAAGNVMTLPTLILQREFPAASFGKALGLLMSAAQFASALMPGMLGALHDFSASYGPVFATCSSLPLLAIVMVVYAPAPSRGEQQLSTS
ncbi:conserved membrane hypothetical protein [Bradyrhizobium sp. ORS 375]|uniref:MFS transporter n=1 Tax=Bradyrhizobium sp. (strain ORS 375) TaxID=566679 RepID=UPI0002407043|nr:MFS transporter [Bradyrhizobium sp. ORS 375]CCD97205.1 conserved membrane hypothetical protein [Bradyrhizobium sp. ORS 375]